MMADLAFWLAAPAAAIRVALGLLFLRAAWSKLRDLGAFDAVMSNYGLLPERLVPPAARLLAATEAGLGALLLSGRLTPLAGGLAASLFGLFAASMAINIRRGRSDISCGCLPAYAARERLTWGGVLATAALMPASILAGLSGSDLDLATVAQAGIAGLLLFSLHDTALRLAALPRAGARS